MPAPLPVGPAGGRRPPRLPPAPSPPTPCAPPPRRCRSNGLPGTGRSRSQPAHERSDQRSRPFRLKLAHGSVRPLPVGRGWGRRAGAPTRTLAPRNVNRRRSPGPDVPRISTASRRHASTTSLERSPLDGGPLLQLAPQMGFQQRRCRCSFQRVGECPDPLQQRHAPRRHRDLMAAQCGCGRGVGIRDLPAPAREYELPMPRRPVIPDEEVTNLTAKVRTSHVRVLDAYAKANRMSRAAVARLAIEQFVSRPEVRSAAGVDDGRKRRRRSSA